LPKHGAHFHESTTGQDVRYDFAEAFDPIHPYAFEVPRDEFDELLFRHAGELGADLREDVAVESVITDGGRAAGVAARYGASGKAETISARFVVDATGRDALTAHASRATKRIPGLDKTALFSQWRGAWRDTGVQQGDIQIVVTDFGWFWFIPFKDGRTSVGVVVSSAWLKARAGQEPDAMYHYAVASSPVATRFLSGATQVFPAGATADFSFRVRDMAGDGWLAVGDSGGFIDPLFSTGAHLAIRGGVLAGDAIADALRDGDVSRGRFAAWEAAMRKASELFVGAVQSFYRGPLAQYIFAQPQHPFLRRSITSMLAGDVFGDDGIWRREMRTRFPAALDPDSVAVSV
jgi:flavin-dependent dehydrogenase